MKLQDAKRKAILQQWWEMVQDCRNSGQTVAAWCREHILLSVEVCMGTGKQKTTREKHRTADDPDGRKAVGSSKL